MKKLLLGSFLAALVMFVFGAVFWMTIGMKSFKMAPDDVAAQAVLKAQFPETGSYFIPSACEGEEAMKRHAEGPIALVSIRQQGCNPMDPMMMISGFIHEWVTLFLLGFILCKVSSGKDTYCCRVIFFTMVGVIVAFYSSGNDIIWWLSPLTLPLFKAGYTVLAFLLSGLVLAKFTGAACPCCKCDSTPNP